MLALDYRKLMYRDVVYDCPLMPRLTGYRLIAVIWSKIDRRACWEAYSKVKS